MESSKKMKADGTIDKYKARLVIKDLDNAKDCTASGKTPIGRPYSGRMSWMSFVFAKVVVMMRLSEIKVMMMTRGFCVMDAIDEEEKKVLKSTRTLGNDVLFMILRALHVQNINHSAFRSMFEREKLSGNNFNDWFCQLKLILRVEKKLFVIEQPLPTAPAADSEAQVLAQWNAVYDAYNEELKSMFEKQAGVERFDLIQTFHACKHDEGKSISSYVLKMKGYMEQLERLGYVLQQDLCGGLIMTLLAATPQVMTIQGGRIQKANKKLLNAKGKEYLEKNDACHHCKELGHWKRNCSVYIADLIKKKKQVGTASSSVSKNDVLYFNAIPSNGIYEIDMINCVPNVNSIYNVSNERVKHNLDSTYMWHCRLAHLSKKRIEKLQHNGLLKSTDEESFDKLIHTDVCGPFRHVSRQGASYFITFTDDYSRYGYVYSLKHKHEVFETFKVFKNEVENQLGKTIKALRSDRGGEYIRQEFKDYLKACGIVQQLIPLFTPQYNGDYALEIATRILNMVPTKKIDKTQYELWYGKVPNLSYLKV
ncbi:retrotransposon protein, putative, ty1-copia subclass [Tanacetum coccineum]